MAKNSKKPVDCNPRTCDCCGQSSMSATRGTTHIGCTGLNPALTAHVANNPKLKGRLKGQTKGTWR